MKTRPVLATLVNAVSRKLAANASAADHNWDIYANPKYGYTVCWPKDLLKAERVSDSGDGREFKGAHGVIMRAYGSYRMSDVPDTFQGKVDNAVSTYAAQARR